MPQAFCECVLIPWFSRMRGDLQPRGKSWFPYRDITWRVCAVNVRLARNLSDSRATRSHSDIREIYGVAERRQQAFANFPNPSLCGLVRAEGQHPAVHRFILVSGTSARSARALEFELSFQSVKFTRYWTDIHTLLTRTGILNRCDLRYIWWGSNFHYRL